MQINSALQALRGDSPAQRHAQEAVETVARDWRGSVLVKAIEEELARFAEGRAWDDCTTLSRLIADHALASEVLELLFDPLGKALEKHPFAHAPFRHQYSNGTALLQLAQAGSAVMVLLAYDESVAVAEPESVSFSDVERHEIVLAGAADLRIAELLREEQDRAAIDCEPRRVVAGDSMHFGAKDTRIAERIHGRMLVLRVARSPARPEPSRAFRLSDGALIHRASGDRVESQREMAMAVLGRMGRTDAAPLIAALTREGSDHFRWQALRECLALDTATGFAALHRMAADAQDTLADQAGALRAQLLEAYPQLASIEERQKCPA
ncbi:MAG: hypothetical protein R3E14_02095 [Erythrobacter sp.]